MSRNPITFSIHWHQELFQKDEDARMKKQLDQYKKHVYTPQAEARATTMAPGKLLIADVTRLQPYIVGGDMFREHIEALIATI